MTSSVSPGNVKECPFCEIARGVSGSAEVVCQEESWVAFFPHDPATPGHTLVIPRNHYPDIWSLNPVVGSELMSAVIDVGQAIERALQPDGMNLISSSGQAAEQTVFHLHLHLVPRFKDDGFGRLWPPDRPMEEKLKDELADRIRAECQTAGHS